MKKILFILSLILLCSCEADKAYRECMTHEKTKYPYTIHEVQYKGHDYIIFDGTSSNNISGVGSGAVHNPDCQKCNNNKK